MIKPETPEIWVIQHKETKEIFKAPSGKSSWRKPAHAKNAWGTLRAYYDSKESVEKISKPLGIEPIYRDCKYYPWDFPKFDEQDTWELVKLETQVESRLGDATLLLQQCLGRVTDSKLEKEILEFLGEGD